MFSKLFMFIEDAITTINTEIIFLKHDPAKKMGEEQKKMTYHIPDQCSQPVGGSTDAVDELKPFLLSDVLLYDEYHETSGNETQSADNQ